MTHMKGTKAKSSTDVPVITTIRNIGCVSYLNAKPLIHGVDNELDTSIQLGVPSQLLEMLMTGKVDIALCPVIDYFNSKIPLQIIPVGGIGCKGPTLTVRLYSRVPFEQITCIHTDTDSHTSITLLQIILYDRYNLTPTLKRYTINPHTNKSSPHETILMIGDKVVTNQPPANDYPYQLDLGEAWQQQTGLPFVFAVWMAPVGTNLEQLPAKLNRQRIKNSLAIDKITQLYAPHHNWPMNLARQYLSEYLCFEINRPQINAIQRFGELAYKLKLIGQCQPLRLFQDIDDPQ